MPPYHGAISPPQSTTSSYLAEDRQSYQPVEQEMQQMTDILDAKYKKANLDEIAADADHLTSPPIVNKNHYSNF